MNLQETSLTSLILSQWLSGTSVHFLALPVRCVSRLSLPLSVLGVELPVSLDCGPNGKSDDLRLDQSGNK